MSDFFGPKAEACDSLAIRFGVGSGSEQDWEFIYADPAKVLDWIRLIRSEPLDSDERDALATLTLASVLAGLEEGRRDVEIDLVREILVSDPSLFRRMSSFWRERFADDFPDRANALFSPI